MIDPWIVTVALLAVGAAAVCYYLKTVYSFFDGTGIPTVPYVPLFGSLWDVSSQKYSFPELSLNMYNYYPTAKYTGFFEFLQPLIVIRDMDLLKSVTVKNFDHFQNHRPITSTSESLFSKNLFFLRDERWRDVRTMLSPAFTSSKMREMFKLMRECAIRYGEVFATLPKEERSIELKDAFTRYTNDVIATCAFGVTVNSISDRNNRFYVYGRRATVIDTRMGLKFLMTRYAPRLSKVLGINVVEPKIAQFFQDLISSTIQARDEQGIVRPDMIQLMMETRGKLGPGRELTIEDMTAQAFVFFFGGFESTSTLMCFAAYEIGVNPDVQRRLQEEIDEVLKNCKGDVSYEAVNDMNYLDAIVNEALRMYPAVIGSDRVCTKPFELPPTVPGAKPYLVKKGDTLWIPIYGIQMDPQYYEKPTKFNPDRFLEDPKKILNSGMFLSFGIGPRMCIGNRFAILETKVLLFHMFARCNLKPNEKTIIPMKFSKKIFQTTSESGFWFDVVPRETAAPGVNDPVDGGSGI